MSEKQGIVVSKQNIVQVIRIGENMKILLVRYANIWISVQFSPPLLVDRTKYNKHARERQRDGEHFLHVY